MDSSGPDRFGRGGLLRTVEQIIIPRAWNSLPQVAFLAALAILPKMALADSFTGTFSAGDQASSSISSPPRRSLAWRKRSPFCKVEVSQCPALRRPVLTPGIWWQLQDGKGNRVRLLHITGYIGTEVAQRVGANCRYSDSHWRVSVGCLWASVEREGSGFNAAQAVGGGQRDGYQSPISAAFECAGHRRRRYRWSIVDIESNQLGELIFPALSSVK